MRQKCPKCLNKPHQVIKFGSYVRKSDSKLIPRYRCKNCGKSFSSATSSPCYHQNKRRLNPIVKKLLASSVSMRRIAKICNISRTTVSRKVTFLAQQARLQHKAWLEQAPTFECLQFDDLETFEHTKCKPISLCLFVDQKTRKIVDYTLYPIGAKGPLAKLAREKYGVRRNTGALKRRQLFKRLKPLCSDAVVLSSDESPLYTKHVKEFFPKAVHRRHKGRRGCVTGQGELKSGGFDPLFSINHTFAMMRDNLKRLARRTWCTTKKLEALNDHVAIYVDFHNQVLT